MHGNEHEWCQDWYGPYESFRVVSDPTGPASGVRRVLRSGGYRKQPKYTRSTNRVDFPLDLRIFGFRLVLSR